MNCSDMELRMAEYLAGETPRDDRSLIEHHLMDCAACRGQFNLAKLAWDSAQDWRTAQPSEALSQRTRLAVRQGDVVSPFNRTTLGLLRFGTLAAGVLVCILAVGSLSRPTARPVAEASRARTAAKTATGLATVSPSLGKLFVRDEDGRPAGELAINRLTATIDINEGIARTEIEEVFFNGSDRRLEGTFLFPLPPDASISRLAMEIDGKLMEGEVRERESARQIYEGIVRKMQDPALLEWMPGGIFKCRVFPIEAKSDKRIIIAYTQALPYFDGKYRYVYPLAGETATEKGIDLFEVAATIRAGTKIVSVSSPSHDAKIARKSDGEFNGTFSDRAFKPKADFVLDVAVEPAGEVQAAVYRIAGDEEGFFAAFVTPRPDGVEMSKGPRSIVFLLDASASVSAPQMDVARKVIEKMIESLGAGDTFKIASHNLATKSMAEFVANDREGRQKASAFLYEIKSAGACDLERSLVDVMATLADGTELVYLGEGTPTLGENDPAKLVAKAKGVVGTKAVTLRTVAVGSTADRTLLETLAREFNGGSHFISPSDDVPSRVAEISRTLGRSALNDLKVEFEGPVTAVAPAKIGSIHFGERLMVCGRYAPGAVKMVLTGKVHGRVVRREFPIVLAERDEKNLFVKKLWAQRRLTDLVAQGAEKKAEAIDLSVKFQVMTPYTSFLVLENEEAYKKFGIERTKKDETNDPSKARLTGAQDKKLKDETVRKAPASPSAPPPASDPALNGPRPDARPEPRTATPEERPRDGFERSRELPKREEREDSINGLHRIDALGKNLDRSGDWSSDHNEWSEGEESQSLRSTFTLEVEKLEKQRQGQEAGGIRGRSRGGREGKDELGWSDQGGAIRTFRAPQGGQAGAWGKLPERAAGAPGSEIGPGFLSLDDVNPGFSTLQGQQMGEYLRDYDIQGATAAAAADPVPQSMVDRLKALAEGLGVDVTKLEERKEFAKLKAKGVRGDEKATDPRNAKFYEEVGALQKVLVHAFELLKKNHRTEGATENERALEEQVIYAINVLPGHLSATWNDALRRAESIRPLYGQEAELAYNVTVKLLDLYRARATEFAALVVKKLEAFDRAAIDATLAEVQKAWGLVEEASRAASIDAVGSVTSILEKGTAGITVRLDSLVVPGDTFVLKRGDEFVAVVRVDKVEKAVAFARIYSGLQTTAILAGDSALRIHDDRDLWQHLPDQMKNDLLSQKSLAAIRSTMRALREMKAGNNP